MTGDGRLLAAGGTLLGVIGVVWLAPLMLDQFVLFADQEQTAIASQSRRLMIWPTLFVVGAALVIAVAGRGWPATIAALPLVAVGLAHVSPQMLWQLLAYGVTAPLSIGAMLAAVAPIRGRLSAPPMLFVLLLAGLAAALTTAFLAALVVIGLVAWWLLSRTVSGPPAASALD
jgi:hypothetical protein